MEAHKILNSQKILPMPSFVDILEEVKQKISDAQSRLDQVIETTQNIVTDLPNLGENLIINSEQDLTGPNLTVAQGIFGDSLDYDAVVLNDTSFMADINQHWNNSSRPFVLGNTINSAGPLTQEELIHELTHVWQYQTGGLSYITDSITNNNYAYDASTLGQNGAKPMGERMGSYNVEQQAEIIAHYFTLNTIARPLPTAGIELHNMVDAQGNAITITEGNIDQYIHDLRPYVEEVRETPRLTGVAEELHEAPVEIIEEMGEGVEEVASEVHEGYGEISSELNDGDYLGAAGESIEAAAEVGYETVEGLVETQGEIIEGAVEIGVDGAIDLGKKLFGG